MSPSPSKSPASSVAWRGGPASESVTFENALRRCSSQISAGSVLLVYVRRVGDEGARDDVEVAVAVEIDRLSAVCAGKVGQRVFRRTSGCQCSRATESRDTA
jgi:hypothetical protein